jgi:hypothetical protein
VWSNDGVVDVECGGECAAFAMDILADRDRCVNALLVALGAG